MTLRESLLWGVIGGLSFLVLLQGYELLTSVRVDLAVKFGVAVLVTVVATVSAHLAAPRLFENGSA